MINLQAGLRTHSIIMKCEDYLKVENPIIGEFIKPRGVGKVV